MRRDSAKFGGATTAASAQGGLVTTDLGALPSDDAEHGNALAA